MKQFNIYPSLLNDFAHYLNETGSEFGGEPWVNEQSLIDRINRVPITTTVAMGNGNLFEKAVQLADLDTLPVFENKYILGNPDDPNCLYVSQDVLRKAVELYRKGVWQFFVQTKLHLRGSRVILYGYVDVIRQNIATDIKTSSTIKFHSHKDMFQHGTYLTALNGMGAKIDYFDYFKTDFNDYDIERVNNTEQVKSDLIEHIERFMAFLETNQDRITDKKIMLYDTTE